MVPEKTEAIGILDPTTLGFTTVPARSGFRGGVLAPNGLIYFIPSSQASIGIFNPATLEFEAKDLPGGSDGKYIAGVALQDGTSMPASDGAAYNQLLVSSQGSLLVKE